MASRPCPGARAVLRVLGSLQVRAYLDHNATTPVAAEVADAMHQAVRGCFGNASSIHAFGQAAKAALDDARSAVAALLGARPNDVIFTGSGTEADNLAIRGVAEASPAAGRRHLIASAIEHEAVLNTLKALSKRGWTSTLLPVGDAGVVEPAALEAALTDDTALVSVMHANNEIGTLQPIAELAGIAHRRGAVFHTDAVQTAGKLPLDVGALGVDLLSISAHKFNGPKGVGALWIRRGMRLVAPTTGGRQERNRRAGTENVPAIVGLGVAARLAAAKLSREAARLRTLRDRLESSLLDRVPDTAVNGGGERVPNTTNISFHGVEAEALLIALDLEGIAVSTGSACSSGTLEPSHVLRAMGLTPRRAQSSIRFSLGLGNTDDEIDRLVGVLPPLVARLRALSRAGAAHAPA
ncbi:MAG: cysteine desulfurase [Acidobacteria bacterium]|nr:cysteine desulfurase [Chloroflexota bacterium]MYN65037.1 cysteine desulfurase [Acidobacteriota bacterium]